MQDRPTAIELLDALRDFMRDRAEHSRDRWERFQFQVAANSLGIIGRELAMDDAFMREEWHGLDRLLGVEPAPETQEAFRVRLRARNEELAHKIRNGGFDDTAAEAELLPHILATVVNKVRIASPNEAPQ